jgi:uncharacterized membrane protein YdjX (TVP38/TMEM64 family)
MTERQRRILDVAITLMLTTALAWGVWSFFKGEIVFDLYANDTTQFRDYLVGLGAWAWFTYVWLIVLEVLIAFIPGWFVYPIGAALFGFMQAVALIMMANFIGASMSFWIGRRWGKPLVQKFVSRKYLVLFDKYMERNGTWAIFLLKVNPVTSFDFWNYVAGASNIGFWRFTIANMLGIFPLVLFFAAVGEQTFELAPQILGILILLTALYVVWYFVSLPRKISEFKKRKIDNSQ